MTFNSSGHFEEARLKELSAPNKANGNKVPGGASQLKPHEGKPTEGGLKPSEPADLSRQDLFKGRPGGSGGRPRCYHCGQLGHISRDCRQQRSSALVETRVRSRPTVPCPQGGNIAAIGANETVATEQRQSPARPTRVEELRSQLQEDEVAEAMANLKATMHGITAPESNEGAPLGPTIHGEVEFESMPGWALLDTGSPITIASLDCVLQALAKQRTPEQMPDAWEKMVRATVEGKKKKRTKERTRLHSRGRLTPSDPCHLELSVRARGTHSLCACAEKTGHAH